MHWRRCGRFCIEVPFRAAVRRLGPSTGRDASTGRSLRPFLVDPHSTSRPSRGAVVIGGYRRAFGCEGIGKSLELQFVSSSPGFSRFTTRRTRLLSFAGTSEPASMTVGRIAAASLSFSNPARWPRGRWKSRVIAGAAPRPGNGPPWVRCEFESRISPSFGAKEQSVESTLTHNVTPSW
jgi:hypothetical protein